MTDTEKLLLHALINMVVTSQLDYTQEGVELKEAAFNNAVKLIRELHS